MNFAEVLSRFKNPQRNGKGYKVRCPCHDDKVNSLSIVEADNGKILLKCHAACSPEAVIDAVGLTWRDLRGAEKENASRKYEPVVARYIYVDEDSKPLFRACRTRTKPDGSKDFFQERFDAASGKYIIGMNGTRRVLYHLPAIVAAETVFIVEGEKDAERLTALGLEATTNVGGAGKWLDSYSAALKGKNAIIFPDADQPGENHALMVARSVFPVAKSVKIVSLPDIPAKGDVSDYLENHTKEELLSLVESSPSFTGNADSKGQGNLWPQFLTAKEILQAPKDPTRWILEDCLPAGGASLLVAKPKVIKTTLAADLSISVSRGEPFLGRATQQCPVAYVFLDGPITDIAETFVRLGLRESDPVFIHAGSAPADAIAWILATVKDKGARLVVIDVLQKLCRFDKIESYSEVMTKMEPLLEAARDGNCHIMTLHHAKKDSHDDLDAAIGSTALRGLCYTYLFAKRLPNSNRRILHSDQRGGKNFSEMGIGFDKVTGRLRVEGTIEEVEVEEARPEILKFLETEECEVMEKDIRQAVTMRGWVVGRALRALVKSGEVERTGEGKRSKPYRYSRADSLLDNKDFTDTIANDTHSRDTSPISSLKGNGTSGLETSNNVQAPENSQKDSSPDSRDKLGTSRTSNEKETIPGLETKDGWEWVR